MCNKSRVRNGKSQYIQQYNVKPQYKLLLSINQIIINYIYNKSQKQGIAINTLIG